MSKPRRRRSTSASTKRKHDVQARSASGSENVFGGDFRRFHNFASFFCIVLNASKVQLVYRYAHFLGVCMDPNNFRFKIHEISTLEAKCYLNVTRIAPDMKIMECCKVLPSRAQNVISHPFLKAPHRGFSVIFVDFTILVYFSTSF